MPILLKKWSFEVYARRYVSKNFCPPGATELLSFRAQRRRQESVRGEFSTGRVCFSTCLTRASAMSSWQTPAGCPAGYRRDLDDWIIIDEVQKVPALLDEVHRLIETRRLRFVLTGSSARRLRADNVNLLARRALTCRMHPLTAAEQGGGFQPGAGAEIWAVAYGLYVRRPGGVPAELRADLPAGGGPNGGVDAQPAGVQPLSWRRRLFPRVRRLNVSAVARDCAVNRKVTDNYFSILRDTLVSHEIPVFAKRKKRRVIGSAKFYFFDAGVFRALRPAGPYDSDAEAEGAALETLVLQEIIACNDCRRRNYSVCYWRTRQGAEVDFVLYGARGLKAIEVKRSGRVRREDFKGLRQFRDEYPEAELIFVYSGERPAPP